MNFNDKRRIAMMIEAYKSDLCSSMGLYARIGEKIGQKLRDHRKVTKNK